ncbi:MAG TPA: peptidylprolyl isomerase [Pirellulales bacterium]|nr:peptidylprolyl isomerase [Pirellulales bacterium]
MARLFYPTLFCVTAALAAALWAREGWPVDWLRAFDAELAQAQATDAPPGANRPSRYQSRYPTTSDSASRYTNPNADSRAGGAAFPRPAAPPSGARLRISAPGVTPGAAGGDPQADGAPIQMESTKLLARIGGGEHILFGDVMAEVYKEFAKKAPRYPPEQQQALLMMLVHRQVQTLIPYKVLMAEVRRKVPKEELEKTIRQVEYICEQKFLPIVVKDQKLSSVEALEAQLKAEGSSLAKLKQTFVEQQLAAQFLTDHTKVDEEVHPDELLAYYHAHYEEYMFPAKVRWEQLLVKFSSRGKIQARQLIADMGNQVRAGAPWGAVAKARSEGSTAEDGGVWDWTSQGAMKFKELDEALFKLPIGAMSQILEDDRSVQIVRVTERTEAGVISFEEKQREIKKLIVDERIKKKKDEYVRKVMAEYKPQIWTIFDRPPEDEKQPETARKPGAAAR